MELKNIKNLLNLNLPPQFNFKLIKNKKNKNLNIIIFNNKKILNFFSNNNYIFLNKSLNSVKLLINKLPNNIIYNLKNFINFLKSWDYYFFKKVKFKGKGYKIKYYPKKKLINFFFGKSHLTLFKYKSIKIKKITKYKYIIKSTNLNKLNFISKKTISIKPINFYTLRGLRISKQLIFKRKGKKNTYI